MARHGSRLELADLRVEQVHLVGASYAVAGFLLPGGAAIGNNGYPTAGDGFFDEFAECAVCYAEPLRSLPPGGTLAIRVEEFREGYMLLAEVARFPLEDFLKGHEFPFRATRSYTVPPAFVTIRRNSA